VIYRPIDPDLGVLLVQNGVMSRYRRVDVVAAAAFALMLVVTVVYIWLMHQQGDRPLAWVLGVLLGAAALTGYGARADSRHRRGALLVAGVVLTPLGILAILTIGAPILLAGVLCLISASRVGGL
jgi:hypothetical protein